MLLVMELFVRSVPGMLPEDEEDTEGTSKHAERCMEIRVTIHTRTLLCRHCEKNLDAPASNAFTFALTN
jgi:hypothetical protein